MIRKEMIILEFDIKNLSKKTINKVIMREFGINNGTFFYKTNDNRTFSSICKVEYPSDYSVRLEFITSAERFDALQKVLDKMEVKVNKTINYLSELKRNIEMIYPDMVGKK